MCVRAGRYSGRLRRSRRWPGGGVKQEDRADDYDGADVGLGEGSRVMCPATFAEESVGNTTRRGRRVLYVHIFTGVQICIDPLPLMTNQDAMAETRILNTEDRSEKVCEKEAGLFAEL